MSKIPSDEILESLYKLRIRESVQIKTVLELYNMEIHQKISMPNYQNLHDNGDEEKRSESSDYDNVDARHEKNRDGSSGYESKGIKWYWMEGKEFICFLWKEIGQCSKGDQMQFPVMRP